MTTAPEASTAAGTPPAPAPPAVPAPPAAKKPAAVKPEKPNTVTHVRPVATAVVNAANVAAATAVYTQTAPIVAAVAGIAIAGTAVAAGKRMKKNKRATGSVWRAERTTATAGRRTTSGSAGGTLGAGSLGLGGGTGRRGAEARRLARKLGGPTAGAGRGGNTGGSAGGGRGRGSGSAGGSGSGGGRGSGSGGGQHRGGNGGRNRRRRRQHSTGPGDGGMPHTSGQRKPSKLEDPEWVAQQRKKAEARRRKKREQQQRRERQEERRRKENETGPNPIPDPSRPSRYGNRARRPDGTDPQEPPRARPQRPVDNRRRRTNREPVGASASGGIPVGASGMRTLIKMVEDVEKAARKAPFPDGAVEIIRVEYALMGDLVRAQARVFGAYHARTIDPVEGVFMPKPVTDAILAVQSVIMKSADTADKIPPLALKVCAQMLDDLDDPTRRVWDQRANPGGSGRAAA